MPRTTSAVVLALLFTLPVRARAETEAAADPVPARAIFVALAIVTETLFGWGSAELAGGGRTELGFALAASGTVLSCFAIGRVTHVRVTWPSIGTSFGLGLAAWWGTRLLTSAPAAPSAASGTTPFLGSVLAIVVGATASATLAGSGLVAPPDDPLDRGRRDPFGSVSAFARPVARE